MGEFEQLDDCFDRWSQLPAKRRTRKQQAVVDVLSTVAAVEGDGIAGWWSGVLQSDEPDQEVARILESFRLAGLESLAEMIGQTAFCRDVVSAAIASEADTFEFSPDQSRILDRCDLAVSQKGPDAREALLPFLPRPRGGR